MTQMTHEQLIEGLEPIEKRYKQDYSTQERAIIYKRFSWMTGEMWQELCGLVVAADSFRIPAVDDFTKTQMAHSDKFRRIRKVNEPCETCKGGGTRMFLQRRLDKKHVAPAARCDCRNGENWPRYPSVEETEKLPGFFQFVERGNRLAPDTRLQCFQFLPFIK